MAVVRRVHVRIVSAWKAAFGAEPTNTGPSESVFGGNFGGNF